MEEKISLLGKQPNAVVNNHILRTFTGQILGELRCESVQVPKQIRNLNEFNYYFFEVGLDSDLKDYRKHLTSKYSSTLDIFQFVLNQGLKNTVLKNSFKQIVQKWRNMQGLSTQNWNFEVKTLNARMVLIEIWPLHKDTQTLSEKLTKFISPYSRKLDTDSKGDQLLRNFMTKVVKSLHRGHGIKIPSKRIGSLHSANYYFFGVGFDEELEEYRIDLVEKKVGKSDIIEVLLDEGINNPLLVENFTYIKDEFVKKGTTFISEDSKIAIRHLNRNQIVIEVSNKEEEEVNLPLQVMELVIEKDARKDLREDDGAMQAGDQAIEIKLNDANADYYKGVALNDLKLNEEAIQADDQTLKFNPDYFIAYNNRSVVLGDIGMNKEDIQAYDKVIKIDPNDALAYFNKGIILSDIGMNKEAIQAYDEVIKIDPNNISAYLNKSITLSNLGMNKEAIQACDEAIKIDPTYAFAYNNKGAALRDLGMNKEAIQACDEAIKIDPNNISAYLNKGLALNNLGIKKEAIQAYDQAINFNPPWASVYNNKGDALRDLGMKKEAIQAYDQAIKIDPNELSAYFSKSFALYDLGMNQEATQTYDQVLKIIQMMSPRFSVFQQRCGSQ